jgi:long-chain acyl-CoA synthetase
MPQAQVKPWPAMTVAEANARLGAPGQFMEIQELEIRGIRTKVWKNQPPTLRSIVENTAYDDAVCLVYEDERITYRAFRRAVSAMAWHLMELGVRKGDRVALIMRNLPEWAVVFYGAASMGAIVTPQNAWWTGAELEYALRDSGSNVAVVDAERYRRLAGHFGNCPDIEHVLVTRHEGALDVPHSGRLEDVLGASETWEKLPDRPLPAVDLQPDDDATIFYTSGTTGAAKGALGTHRGANSCAMSPVASACRNLLRLGEEISEAALHPKLSVLIGVPFFHVTGCLAILNQALVWGGKVAMMYKWDPVRAFQLIEREKISRTGGVPTIIWQMADHPERKNYDLSSLTSFVYGGAPAPAELVRRIQEIFPNVRPTQAWGMTETSAGVTTNFAKDYIMRPDSCGPATPVATLQIRDVNDGKTELPAGEVGELWSFGPMNCKEYWNKPEATAYTFVDGWVRTGDLARLDEEGFCYIVDRAKDVVIRGGENIYSPEVEAVLHKHPAVAEAALVGRPHTILGEEPVAIVTLHPGKAAGEDELRAFVAQELAAFKVPVNIIIRDQPMPRNENGKILKPKLKQAHFAP